MTLNFFLLLGGNEGSGGGGGGFTCGAASPGLPPSGAPERPGSGGAGGAGSAGLLPLQPGGPHYGSALPAFAHYAPPGGESPPLLTCKYHFIAQRFSLTDHIGFY